MAERSYRWLLWGLVLLGTGTDQVSKYGVFRWLYNKDSQYGEYSVIPGAFKLLAQFKGPQDLAEPPEPAGEVLNSLRTWSAPVLPKVNHGALFGLGSEYEKLANRVFAVVSVVAALAIASWSLRRATARDAFLCAALGLILAGTLGNLYDRLIFNGVRDFLYFYWIEWPVFNVADCCLVCGACLLLLQAFCTRPVPGTAKAPELAMSAAEAK